jgi:metal-responsive CopG/Arc/MetJ family transcriptional regulator
MRTTIELPDELRARLLELAASRGKKGFSFLVKEAVERYLVEEDEAERRRRIDRALSVLGTLSDDAADHMEGTRRRLREDWR